ncbi:MAG: hypothetical protein GXP61_06755 [Epsilonproteobacteria bacterium]|nr:hypothetical protein [Campylobacterota bacterium]
MLQMTLGDKIFSDMMSNHIEDILDFLLEKGVSFSMLTNVASVNFEPALPSDIRDSFKSITLFVLAGYTFESTVLDGDIISFEAGFGSDNFGSLVSVPLASVLQVIVEDTPIFINLSIPSAKEETKKQEVGVKKSMEALLSNPENKKLLKNN